MPLSAKSLHRSGRISDKAMAKLQVQRGTKTQPSKMANFNSKQVDNGNVNNKGKLPVNQINSKQTQNKGGFPTSEGRIGPPSKGGGAGKPGQIPTNQIGAGRMQQPKFPAGGNVKASNRVKTPARLKGTKSEPSGPVYDVPDRNAR